VKKGPDFIIIGAMKAGTSTLHQQFAQQAGVSMSRPKEPNFFSNDEQYARGIEWYRSLFAPEDDDDICGESSTHYTKLPTYPNTVPRMVQDLPDIKLIYVIRHPIDRLVSHYIHAWTEKWISEPIEKAIGTYSPLITYGQYARQLQPYLEAYHANQIRVVFFERLVRDPEYILRDLAQHVGVPGKVAWRYDVGRQNNSEERMRRSAVRDAIVNAPILSHMRRCFVPSAMREWMKGFWRLPERPSLPESVVAELEAVFDQDLAQFKEWFGVSVRCSSFKEVAQKHDLVWRVSPTTISV